MESSQSICSAKSPQIEKANSTCWPPRRLLRPYRHGPAMKALSLPKSVICASQNANVREISVRAAKFESFASNAVLGPEPTNLGDVTIGSAVRCGKQGDNGDLIPHLCCLDRLGSESCSDPRSKHHCGRVRLERCRCVGRAGTRAIFAQVHRLLAHYSSTNPKYR